MNTRRNFMRGLSGLGAIVATGHAPAIVKSMIAARGTMLGGAHAWTNPYITDGLIAMWDGEFPGGVGGKTAQTASEWVDFIKGYVYGRGTNIIYDPTNKCFVLDKIAQSDANRFTFDAIPASGGFTVEIVCAGTWAYTNGMSLIRTNGQNTIFVYPSYVQIRPAGSSADVSGIGLNTPFYYANAFTTGNNNNKLYYNGEYKTAGGTPSGLDPLTYIQAPAQSLSNRVSGNIYAVRVYSRPLSADEIAANYAVDKERFNLPS